MFLLLSACHQDLGLKPTDAGPPMFDSGVDTSPFETDTDDALPEDCNGLDDDGDGQIDEDFPDLDGDGVADCVDDACAAALEPEMPVTVEERCGGIEWSGDGDVAGGIVEWGMTSEVAYNTPVIANLTDDDGDGDIDDDDTPDILAVQWAFGALDRFSGDGSGVTRLVLRGVDAMAVAVADVDGDGVANIVTSGDDGLCVRDPDGAALWCTYGPSAQYMGGPLVTDLDGDGAVEIIAPPYILDAVGDVRAMGVCMTQNTFPVAGDLDGDGVQEVICGDVAWHADGTVMWSHGGADYQYATLVDVEGDGVPEVVVTGAEAGILLYEADGTLRASVPSTGQASGPCVADFDGDGHAELGLASDTVLEVYELDLTPVWSIPSGDPSSAASCSAFDFDADGSYELVHADEETVWVLDGHDGSVRGSWSEHRSGTWAEYAAIADVDNDGSAEIVAVQNMSQTGILVIGSPTDGWAPAGPVWAQWHFDGAMIDDHGRVDPTPLSPWRDGGMAHARPPLGGFDANTDSWSVRDPAPELLVDITDVCAADCTDGPVQVAVTVRNEGDLDADALVVLYSADTTAGLVEVGRQTVAVPSGLQLQSLLFDVALTAVGDDGWEATIARADGEEDCYDTGDTDRWAEPVCTP